MDSLLAKVFIFGAAICAGLLLGQIMAAYTL